MLTAVKHTLTSASTLQIHKVSVKLLTKLNENQTYVNHDTQCKRVSGEAELELPTEVTPTDTDQKRK